METSRTTFIVFRKPGPDWVEGRHTREQPGWDEHAAFMDRITDEGRVLLAGPYSDLSRVLLIVTATDEADALALFNTDPWTGTILESDGVARWSILIGPDDIRSKSR
jgi:uncharacterized protein YciI